MRQAAVRFWRKTALHGWLDKATWVVKGNSALPGSNYYCCFGKKLHEKLHDFNARFPRRFMALFLSPALRSCIRILIYIYTVSSSPPFAIFVKAPSIENVNEFFNSGAASDRGIFEWTSQPTTCWYSPRFPETGRTGNCLLGHSRIELRLAKLSPSPPHLY